MAERLLRSRSLQTSSWIKFASIGVDEGCKLLRWVAGELKLARSGVDGVDESCRLPSCRLWRWVAELQVTELGVAVDYEARKL